MEFGIGVTMENHFVSLERNKVFFASSLVLDPRRSGGDVVLFDELTAMQRLGYHVSYSAFELMGKRKHLLSDWLLGTGQVEIVRSDVPDSAEAIVDQIESIDIAYLAFWQVAEKFIPAIKAKFPDAAIVFNPVDLHFLRMQRGEKFGYEIPGAPNATETQGRESEIIRSADATLVYSTYERDLLHDLVPGARVEICPWILAPRPRTRGFHERSTISFVGHFFHLPNVDAVNYIADDLLPELRRLGFHQEILVFGDRSTQKVGHLAREGLSIHGTVEELDTIFDDCRISIAPLRFGAGKKGKVAQALARGVPTVVSSIAAEGFGLKSGVNTLIADGAAETAARIVELYNNEELWTRISDNSLLYAEEHFDPAKGEKILGDLLGELTARPHPTSFGRPRRSLCL